MTIAPECPKLVDYPVEEGVRILDEDHVTFVTVGFGYSLQVIIQRGYLTDGATVPSHILEDNKIGPKIRKFLKKKFPNRDVLDVFYEIVGTPWDSPRILAALVHDALYGQKWHLRFVCDWVYHKILVENGYDKAKAEVEHAGIRLFGKRYWDAITDLEIAQTQKITSIKVVKTKNIPQIITKLREKGEE